MTVTNAKINEVSGATARLGAWTAKLRCEDIPDQVREHTKLCLLDGFACGLFGSRQPWGRIAAEVAPNLGDGTASLWGSDARCGPAMAAMANGTAIHGFELDDIHVRSLIHPGAATIPTVFALAEVRMSSGADFLSAVVAGYEVGLRVGICAGVPHGLKGYHPTGTVGCLASSAGAANILRLDSEAATNALGIGATQAAGLYGARLGAMVKRFHAGAAAQAGVTAGLLAERGFTGSPDVLEAPFGGFMSTLTDDADLAVLTDGLGDHWEAAEVGFKAYASCASTHTIIDGLDDLCRRGLRPDNLEILQIRMTTIGASNVGWNYRPAGVVAAQMNGYYAAAVKLLDGDAFIDQYREDRLDDPRIQRLIRKIDIRADPDLDRGGAAQRHASRIRATLTDGRVLETHVAQRKGSPHNPMRPEEIIDKFRRVSSVVLSDAGAEELLGYTLDIERAASLNRISDLLRGQRA